MISGDVSCPACLSYKPVHWYLMQIALLSVLRGLNTLNLQMDMGLLEGARTAQTRIFFSINVIVFFNYFSTLCPLTFVLRTVVSTHHLLEHQHSFVLKGTYYGKLTLIACIEIFGDLECLPPCSVK